MSWKQRKSKSRIAAQSRKKNRGRQSGASNKDTKFQSAMTGLGYTRILCLLSRLSK